MREIKFRAREKETGKWIYGFYVKHQTHTPNPIRPKDSPIEKPEYQHLILRSGFSDWNMPKPLDMHEVEEETVGEFTGLKDKSGKEIFEGDIVKADKQWLSSEDRDIGVVKYGAIPDVFDGCCGFQGLTGFFTDTYQINRITKTSKHHLNDHGEVYSVIGNIYETPELLGASR